MRGLTLYLEKTIVFSTLTLKQTQMKQNKKTPKITKKRVLIIVGIVIVLIISLFVLEKTHIINLYSKPPKGIDDDAKTTSTTPTAQADYTDGNPRDAGNSEQENEGSGTLEDRQGQSSQQTNQSTWSSSASGEIVVKNPGKNSLINSGAEVSGTSNLATVNFRLIDDVSGVIAEGNMNVVNGKFAGVLSFATSANTGRLDIYGVKVDGREFSNVEISVRFK